MKNRIPSALLALSLLAGAATTSFAGPAMVMNQIEKINEKNQTITIYMGPSKSVTYTVPEKAKITINGQPAEFKDLKPQMKAFVNHKSGSESVDSINAQKLIKGKLGGKGHH